MAQVICSYKVIILKAYGNVPLFYNHAILLSYLGILTVSIIWLNCLFCEQCPKPSVNYKHHIYIHTRLRSSILVGLEARVANKTVLQ